MDKIEHVVERSGQLVYILAVKRRDKGLVQPGDHGVSQVVAGVFDLAELADAHLNILHVEQDGGQQLGPLGEIAGHAGEKLEKLGFARNESDHVGILW